MKKYFLWLLMIPWLAEARAFTKSEIKTITESLESSHQKSIEQLLKDRRTQKIQGMVNKNITKPIKLSMKKYKHFTEPYAIRLAKRFMRKWKTQLQLAEKRYQVEAETIAAILLVETSFGRFMGKHQPLAVFASIYVDSVKYMKTEDYLGLSDKLKGRFKKKKNWALGELKAISILTEKYPRLDQIKLRGSYAGAFGKCQFLPSSYLNFAVSHGKRRTPNLFDERDAILSVANYLASNGYKNGLMSQSSYDAIFHYNNSDVYVQTVRNVAKLLN